MDEDTELFEIDDDEFGECMELSLVGHADTVRTVASSSMEDPLAPSRQQSNLMQKSHTSPAVKEEPPPSPRPPPMRRECPTREAQRAPLQQLSPPLRITPLHQKAPRREKPTRQVLSPPPVRTAAAPGAGLRVFEPAPAPAPRARSLAEARAQEKTPSRGSLSGSKREKSGPGEGEPPARRRAAELEYELSSSSPDDPASQREEFMRDFRTGPWLAMLFSADLPPFDLDAGFRLSSCIGELRRQGTSARPRGLVVLVKQLGDGQDSHPVLIKDPTGAMRGQLHPQVVKDNEGMIGEGCVLVLANPPMLYLSEFSQLLSITSKNIVRVFSPKERVPAAYAALSEAQRRFDPRTAYRQKAPATPTSQRHSRTKTPHTQRTPRTNTPRRRRTDALGGSPYAKDSQLTPTAPFKPPADVEDMDEMDELLASIPDDELTPHG